MNNHSLFNSVFVLTAILSFAFFAGIGGLFFWMARRDRQEKETRRNGEVVVGWIVQANNVLWEKGHGDNAAQVLITFDRDLAHDTEEMQHLARKLGRLKEGRLANAREERLAQLVRDETARFSTRYKLPREFTGGPTVYSIAVMIRRMYLPSRRITLPYIYGVAMPGPNGGRVYMTEYPEDHDGRPPARRRRGRD